MAQTHPRTLPPSTSAACARFGRRGLSSGRRRLASDHHRDADASGTGTGRSATPRAMPQDADQSARTLVGSDAIPGRPTRPARQQCLRTRESRSRRRSLELLRLGFAVEWPIGGHVVFAFRHADSRRPEPTLVVKVVPQKLRHQRRSGLRRDHAVSSLEPNSRTPPILGTRSRRHLLIATRQASHCAMQPPSLPRAALRAQFNLVTGRTNVYGRTAAND